MSDLMLPDEWKNLSQVELNRVMNREKELMGLTRPRIQVAEDTREIVERAVANMVVHPEPPMMM